MRHITFHAHFISLSLIITLFSSSSFLRHYVNTISSSSFHYFSSFLSISPGFSSSLFVIFTTIINITICHHFHFFSIFHDISFHYYWLRFAFFFSLMPLMMLFFIDYCHYSFFTLLPIFDITISSYFFIYFFFSLYIIYWLFHFRWFSTRYVSHIISLFSYMRLPPPFSFRRYYYYRYLIISLTLFCFRCRFRLLRH